MKRKKNPSGLVTLTLFALGAGAVYFVGRHFLEMPKKKQEAKTPKYMNTYFIRKDELVAVSDKPC